MTAASTVASTDADQITAGRTALGIELGSTRIKACLIDADDPTRVLAVGAHEWENQLDDGVWTYSTDAVWSGLQSAYAALVADAAQHHGVAPTTYGAIGVSAMMHGYLAFDAAGELLVPFRTWRNTSTGPAAAELTELFGVNIPLRWSIAHVRQALRDDEPHVAQLASINTLAGYVHERLTGRRVLGVGDASGVFPIDAATGDYDESLVARFDALTAREAATGATDIPPLRSLLPASLRAGSAAGELTAAGALLLDPTGALRPGIAFCPPEGDAGTGMVATNAVAPRTGNVSAGTSIFAMVVLERPLRHTHHELDLVATPSGDAVAMVHCNNGASELAAWAALFGRFAAASGAALSSDDVFAVLLSEADAGAADAGGVLAYNHLAGEPIAGLSAGRPLVVRTPEADFSLANLMRAQVYGMFGTLALGMRVLTDVEHGEEVGIDRMLAHGGVFRTAGVAQRMLAAALDVPIAVGATAAEGGAWGIAVLAAYLDHAGETPLAAYLNDVVFASASVDVAEPDPADAAGFAAYLDRYRAGLAVEAAAVTHL